MPYRQGNAKKPSEHLHDLLSGLVEPKDTPEAVLSWARLEIFNAAKAVIAAPNKQKRRAMLEKIPPSIRPFVEREAMKIWKGDESA